MPSYSTKFKARMVQRMVGPGAVTATDLAEETGISQSTLSAWLREARTLGGKMPDTPSPAPATPAAAVVVTAPTTTPPTSAPRARKPQEQLRILALADTLNPEELGAMLRREGLHAAELEGWRSAVIAALQGQAPSAAATTSAADRRRIQSLERELDRKEKACEVLGLSVRTTQRWKLDPDGDDGREGPHTRPANALSDVERQRALSALHRPEHHDASPKTIVAQLADRGEYVASESTLYRLLRAAGELTHRGRAKAPVHREAPSHRATGPNQVWSWDITYLLSAVRGVFYYLYLIVDIWSRQIMGWALHTEESQEHAAALIATAAKNARVDPGTLTLHSDNGGPMRGGTMLAMLYELGIRSSFSRPRVSDDNPFSEALFRTLKYVPQYPRKPFESAASARAWIEQFVRWYNDEHLHSGIGFVTPAARHAGRDVEQLAARRAVYETARAARCV